MSTTTVMYLYSAVVLLVPLMLVVVQKAIYEATSGYGYKWVWMLAFFTLVSF